MLKTFFSPDFTLTKRHLGVILLGAGLALFAGMFVVEAVRSQSDGIGTVQKLGILVGAMSIVVGLSLLPLGRRPA
jgi:Na+/H+ antiporter NhaA